jgi:hypothetical protein
MELRYLGFDQLRSARAFRFEILVKGAGAREAVVTADMALFLQYHVSVQDGPTLCAGKLAADLENQIEGEHVLTADDLRLHSESRAAADAKRLEARSAAGRRRQPSTSAFENPRGRD